MYKYLFVIILIIGVLPTYSPIKSDNTYMGYGIGENQVGDERGWYFRQYGLLQYHRNINMPLDNDKHALEALDKFKKENTKQVGGFLGLIGFYAPRDLYISSGCTLSDPFRSHLPCIGSVTKDWRPGHLGRVVPAGYEQSILGDNIIEDPDLYEYWEAMKYVIRAPLFDWKRIKLIWRFNTGAYQPLLDSWKAKNGYK